MTLTLAVAPEVITIGRSTTTVVPRPAMEVGKSSGSMGCCGVGVGVGVGLGLGVGSGLGLGVGSGVGLGVGVGVGSGV
ncbi:MAG: hypothetical protein NWR17_07360, partial [Candidatus Nanopelagicales bacterium]|nr:hypothetical protein [Candidatus Nanopelagicales bacterium]